MNGKDFITNKNFRNIIWSFYSKNKRSDLPWRKKITPYRIWVSEIMLQQTQVDRVIPFFNTWMKLFPTIKKLAQAPQSEILRAWKGLGYNSRALRMKNTAQIICEKYHGKFPKIYDELLKLPGIGPYTAGAIMAFAYDKSVVMIETNIRRVFIHHFHPSPLRGAPLRRGALEFVPPLRRGGAEGGGVHDRDILELIKKTLPKENFREWYWALMDYGSYLGKTILNPNKKSKHYVVQKKFKGSDREIRGAILGFLLEQHTMTKNKLLKKLREKIKNLPGDPERFLGVLEDLEHEGFLHVHGNRVQLS